MCVYVRECVSVRAHVWSTFRFYVSEDMVCVHMQQKHIPPELTWAYSQVQNTFWPWSWSFPMHALWAWQTQFRETPTSITQALLESPDYASRIASVLLNDSVVISYHKHANLIFIHYTQKHIMCVLFHYHSHPALSPTIIIIFPTRHLLDDV